MTTAPTELKSCDLILFDDLIAAYQRGVEWGRINGYEPREVFKAAYDYADKATSPMNTRAPAVGGVRVRPIQWTESNSRAFSGSFGGRVEYVIQHGTKHFRLYFRSNDEYLGSFDTLDAAKAAAQAHHEAAILSALEPQAVDDVLDKAVEAALHADIIPLTGKHAGAAGVRLIDYLSLDASAAIELGVALTEKDVNGKPAFHWYSDIGCMEREEVQRAILRPLIKAALQVAKEPSHD